MPTLLWNIYVLLLHMQVFLIELCGIHIFGDIYQDSILPLSHSIQYFSCLSVICLYTICNFRNYILATGYFALKMSPTKGERLNLLVVCCSHTLMKLEIQCV